MIVLLGLLWPALLGVLLARSLGRGLPAPMQVFLSLPLGLGAISCSLFVQLETGLPALVFELLVALAAGAVCWRVGTPPCVKPAIKGSLDIWIGVGLAVTLAASLYRFRIVIFEAPQGAWDAWQIWNMHARFLATPYWRDMFSSEIPWTHGDYPLLLPGSIARLWSLTGRQDLDASHLVAFLFTFATIGLLGSAVSALKGRAHGMLAALFLAATPFFIVQGASQCADIPLSFFLLAVVALPAFEEGVLLAGLCAAMAAWTKNEGLLLVAVVAPIRTLALCLSRGVRGASAPTVRFLAGLAPLLAIVLFMRFALAPPNDHIGGRPLAALVSQATDFQRWKLVLLAVPRGIRRLGGLPVGVPVLLLIYGVLAGLEAKCDRLTLWTGSATLAALLAGYCVVCVVQPRDIYWQIDTALYRLLMQLWPAAIFLVFIAVRPLRPTA